MLQPPAIYWRMRRFLPTWWERSRPRADPSAIVSSRRWARDLPREEKREPVHSAGLLIMRDVKWPIVDLRIDWSDDDPVAALGALWRRYAPQIEDYVQRAVDPTRAVSFAVPGDP